MNEWRQIDQLVERLVARFTALDAETVIRVVREIHARYDGRPVRDYIPLFVERHAMPELTLLVNHADCRLIPVDA